VVKILNSQGYLAKEVATEFAGDEQPEAET